MVKAPAVPVSDYIETKTVFLLQKLAEKSSTASETENKTETENPFFSVSFFTYYFFIQKLSKI